uniref:Uncharacterized protein n=2 Tax=Picea TaxID=3328 RepID=A0A124GN91_PICGL|nr:hypothetical protein ABT39_MTgene5064 [Picea glauca]QHR89750.1 hypothetical protein Q903MT_gene3772 [Picea sitchensis]
MFRPRGTCTSLCSTKLIPMLQIKWSAFLPIRLPQCLCRCLGFGSPGNCLNKIMSQLVDMPLPVIGIH